MRAAIIKDFSFVTAMGGATAETLHALDTGALPEMTEVEVLGNRRLAAVVREPLPDIPDKTFDTRTNRLLYFCIEHLGAAWKDVPAERLGIVIGTSNAGIEEFHQTLLKRELTMEDYERMEMGGPAAMLAAYTGAQGPAYCVSTACSSSAKAMACAARLLESGICDAVIAGGTDGLCGYTLAGFESLHLLAEGRTEPFSAAHTGVVQGEGAALFLLQLGEPQSGDILLSGYGESSDAYHPTTPEPDGAQAAAAMFQALGMAGLQPQDIDYVNLHGTGTQANDDMELASIRRVFGATPPPCGGTKPYTGHTLGAAGAVEAAICTLLLQRGGTRLPAQPWLGSEGVAGLDTSATAARPVRHIMSNSFAFGGNNCSLIFSRR